MECAGYRYEKLCVDSENDWHKGSDNFPHTVNEAYTLLESFRRGTNFISNIVKKSKQNERSDHTTNFNLKTNWVLFSTKNILVIKAVNIIPKMTRKRHDHISSARELSILVHIATTNPNVDRLNTREEVNALGTKMYKSG